MERVQSLPGERQISPNKALAILAAYLVVMIAVGIYVGYRLFWDPPPKARLDVEIEAAIQEVRNNPEDAGAHLRLGWALYQKGDKKVVLEHYRQTVDLKPNAVDGRYNT